MPDAIETVRRKDPNLINEVFPKDEQGNAVSEPYFLYKERSCDQQDANSKCYLLVSYIHLKFFKYNFFSLLMEH